jgi:aldose 1-epimerase
VSANVSHTLFGRLGDGTPVHAFTLSNPAGMRAKIIDLGGIITELHVPDRDGVFGDVVLGFDRLEPYLADHPYFGALIGRYANRIAAGRFVLDGAPYQLDLNDGAHHLHGGRGGFHRQKWDAAVDGAVLVLSRRSPAGEQGYPGTLDVVVRYALTDANELVMQCRAETDQPTPVNLTQHSYFNLAGDGDILAHELTIFADAFTPIDAESIPLGGTAPVAGTPFDFRTPVAIGERIGWPDVQLRNGRGYDHNFVLSSPGLAARLHEPRTGRTLELFTTEPGVQFYSGNFLDGSLAGKGRVYGWRSGLCLEPQHFPDSPNRPAFPSTILRPAQSYTTESRYRFTVGE